MRKIQIAVAAFLTVALAGVFYYSFVHPRLVASDREDDSEVADENGAPAFRHPLTGLPRAEPHDFFAVSVMYDNQDDVSLQPGLEQAGIVFEALTEGGITRLMAIFDSTVEVPSVGPVRSVRPYFVDWASAYGGILMHVGGSPTALSQIRASSELLDIDQIGSRERYFSRDETIPAPHNVFTSFSSWLQIGERFDVPMHHIRLWQYEEAASTEHGAGSLHRQLEIDFFPDHSVAWVYDPPTNNYVRFVNGDRHLYETGNQVSAANVVVIEVESTVIDSVGRRAIITIGSGSAMVYREGREISATWVKESVASRLRFISAEQEEIALTPGVTWIAAVPSLDLVRYRDQVDGS